MENMQGSAPVAAPEAVSEASESESQEMQSGEEGSAPSPAPRKPEPPKSSKRMLKLKVDGKELEEEFDPDNEEELVKNLQLAKMAQKRAAETAQLRKEQQEVKSFLEGLKGDRSKFRQLARDMGIDEKELAAQIIEEEIENSKKSPEQLEMEKMRAELSKIAKEKETLEEQRKSEERQRLIDSAHNEYSTKIMQALETAQIPKSDFAVRRVADYLGWTVEHGLKVPVEDIIPLVREETMAIAREHLDNLPDDSIEEFLGKEFMARVRKRNISKGKDKPPVPVSKSLSDVGSEGMKARAKEEAPKLTIKQRFGI